MTRLVPGTLVQWQKNTYVVLDLMGLDSAVLRDVTNGETTTAPTSGLIPEKAELNSHRQDILLVPDDDWNEAWRRYELILPLLKIGVSQRTLADVTNVAKAAGKDYTTIYRWVKSYEATGRVSSLLRRGRADVNGRRLPIETEKIIEEVIKEFHLTLQRCSVAETCLEVKHRCKKANLKLPHPNTIRNRIQEISEKQLMSKRIGHKAARERFQPIKGSFPNADFPLAVVQIDHTPVDLIIVDDKERLPIGRPYLTIAIDCYSRMITGFYVTLEAPSALSAGLCISHSILTKELWLAKYGIATPWPIWGKMRKIYVDNAKEFRGAMLERACNEHGIILEHRPKGLPNYGGHVERAFRTFMSKTHTLSGTTFSNIKEKGEYDSERHASMTLGEFEQWFTTFVVEVYHQRPHKGICDTPPINLYQQAILGTSHQPGIGLPMPIANEQKLRFDFMPFVERTIQEYGILIDNIHYYSDVLRSWIHARDESNVKLKRKFIFVRDPRDISVVYFLDPVNRSYCPVPYRDTSHPPISLWELRAVLKRLETDELLQPNEDIIFEGIGKMREIELAAIQRTQAAKQARRTQQRRKNWNQTHTTSAIEKKPILSLQIVDLDSYPSNDILPFDDIQEAT